MINTLEYAIIETRKLLKDVTGLDVYLDDIKDDKVLPAIVLEIDGIEFANSACGQAVESVNFNVVFCSKQRQSQLSNVQAFDKVLLADLSTYDICFNITDVQSGIFEAGDIYQLRCKAIVS